jgi:hypothetical protein
MSQVYRVDDPKRNARILGLAVLLCTIVACIGCGGAIIGSNHHVNGDPLHLGVEPGPLGTTDPQAIEVRLGSEPSNRIVSISLSISSVQATNSGAENLELLTDPVTIEFTHSGVVTDPVVIRNIYQDTYSALTFSDMTGRIVFYDSNGQLATQSLTVTGGTVSLSPDLVLGATPQVLSISMDLAQTFTVNASSVTVNDMVVVATSTDPIPAVAPATGQPETGSVTFLVGTVDSVDTTARLISLQPSSGNVMRVSYGDATQFVNCQAAMLVNAIVEVEAATQTDGSVLASQVAFIDPSQSSSELYGLLSGHAPDGINYNLIVGGGAGVNVDAGLTGKNVTVDWLAASYAVNHMRLDLSGSDDLVFDEARTFPGQFVSVQEDTLIIPDPDSVNAGFIQPRMIELQEQTIAGQVSNYVYDPTSQTGSFTLNVASEAPIKMMNSGLIAITVRQIPQTYLRNNPTFADGELVKVRGLLFVDPNYNNATYHPPDPVAFIMVADRVSK